ncbi:MAG: hypothetical protein J0H74_13845 [Chitinophagaceae bacterium]|nr:hypothetical protein [Chitinophagaceae bacterium]
MKGLLLPAFSAILLFSCIKGNNFPRVETITLGSKWGLTIGSSPEDVYRQLQTLGSEKNFSHVAVVGRQPFSKPPDVENLVGLYDAITLQSNSGVVDRVIIEFLRDSINYISAGGGLPGEVVQWPQGAPDETAFHKGDAVDRIYPKLLAVYQMPAYSGYQIILPDKPLAKPFDQDMAKYEQWGFSMAERIKPQVEGIYSVRLFFQNGKLSKIWYQYNEGTVVN